jgi:hypothetical protein
VLCYKYFLARTLFDQQKYEESELGFRETLKGDEKTLGETHLYTIKAKYWLAHALYEQQSSQPAKELFNDVLRGRKKLILREYIYASESKHPIERLALVLLRLNHNNDTEEVLRRAGLFEMILGKESLGATEKISELRNMTLICFKHKPLKHAWQIRVIEVMAQEQNDDKLRCKIHIIPGRDAKEIDPGFEPAVYSPQIQYDALSYT